VADDESNRSFFPGAASRQLQEALQRLKTASVLISLTIKDELAGSNDHDVLVGLYCAKGGVTCAIEETERHLGG